ncbi:MAG: SAM-dependent chlorinase/fluorinase [Planctomycetota bacterium]
MKHVVLVLILAAFAGCARTPKAETPERTEVWIDLTGPRPSIVLVTDYGTRDFYVGALQGAIRSVNGAADIFNATHEVKAFDVAEGAYTLSRLSSLWPAGTIFVVIVDPGVGTSRRGIAVRTNQGRIYVGPDNGLFTYVIEREGLAEAREVSNKAYWRPGVISATFHGRDVFGPVAGHIARGVPLSELGPEAKDLVRLPVQAARVAEGRVQASFLHVDTYGNASTNATVDMLRSIGAKEGDTLEAELGGKRIALPWGETYGSVPEGQPVLVIDSDGGVELAINMGHFGSTHGASVGASVSVRKP